MSTRVLFVCTGNSARSQMAEALLRRFGGPDFEAFSAGTQPRPAVNPLAIEEMRAAGIEIGAQRPKNLGQFAGQTFDYVSSVSDAEREACPVVPGAETIAWSFPDPEAVEGDRDARLKEFHRLLVGLEQRIRLFVTVAGKEPAPPAERPPDQPLNWAP
jgi:arsenate reductase